MALSMQGKDATNGKHFTSTFIAHTRIVQPSNSVTTDYNCISPNVGRYYGLVTGPPPAMEATMEAAATMAMEAAAMETATERF